MTINDLNTAKNAVREIKKLDADILLMKETASLIADGSDKAYLKLEFVFPKTEKEKTESLITKYDTGFSFQLFSYGPDAKPEPKDTIRGISMSDTDQLYILSLLICMKEEKKKSLIEILQSLNVEL